MKANQSTKSFLILTSCLMIVMTFSGCIKKRPDQALQGSGLANGDVVKKEDVLSVTETLTATEKLQDATLREYKLTIEDSAQDEFDDLGYVKYTTESELLKNDPRFIGKPGATYTLKRVLQGDRLLVYKVSEPSNISYIEKTNLVKDFGDGKVGVPYLSFPVSYFVVDYIEDADRRRTNQKRERQIVDPLSFSKATHLQVNWSNRNVIFEEDGIDKSSLFPKSYFKKGEWYYSVFKTNASDYKANGNHFEHILTRETGQSGIFRNVRFTEIDKSTFGAISSAIPEEAKKNELSESIVAKLKVNYVKLRIDSGISGVQTERLEKDADYRDADYIQIDFLNSFIASSENFRNTFGKLGVDVKKVKEVIVADEMFSFIVESDLERIRVNFLRKKQTKYQQLATFYEDSVKKFGTFYMSKPTYLLNFKLKVEDDFYKYFRTVRFNPDSKIITYHISEESPKVPAVQKAAVKAVKYLNDAFKHVFKDAPEKGFQIVLSPKRVRSGDPRYNIIDFNSEHNPATFAGLGNPYYDENTGEVISATSFIYYGTTKYIMEKALTEYMGTLSGLHLGQLVSTKPAQSESQIFETYNPNANDLIYMPKENAENLMKQLKHASLSSALNFFPVGNETYIKPCFGVSCKASEDQSNFNINLEIQSKGPRSLKSSEVFLQNALNNIESIDSKSKISHNVFNVNRRSGIKIFQKHCNLKSIQSLYEQFRGSSAFLEQEEVKACIDLVLADFFVPTVVHEILHNFGLDHNMQGSTDKPNYLSAALIKEVYGEVVTEENNPSNTNSIMDYFEYRTDDSPYPGQYDWAVLRYLYRGQVQLADGTYVSLIKPQAEKINRDPMTEEYYGIVDLERKSEKFVRKFGYCMQDEIDWGINPLCDMFDIGYNPYTIVSNYIEEFDYITKQDSIKGKRVDFDFNEVNYSKGKIISKLLKFYYHWRKELITLVGDNNKYLESYKTAEDFYADFASKIVSLPYEDQVRILEYYQVRNVIYSFLRNQVFKAPYTCVFNQTFDNRSGPVFIDFDQIYRRMLSLSNTFEVEEVTGCTNTSVQNVAKVMLFERLNVAFPQAKPNQVGFKYLSEVGNPVKDYSSNVYEAKTIPNSVDIIGSITTKIQSALALLPRHFTPYYGSDELYFPTFLDEPEFRDNFEYFLKNRYVNGFWVNETTSDISSLQLKNETINAILNDKKHFGFKALMNVFGPDGAKFFLTRVKEGQLLKTLKDGNQDLFTFLGTSPYVHNVASKDYLAEFEDPSVEDQAQAFSNLYNMGFVTSYLSEATLLPIFADFFRSGLNVPNNLSISAQRTERFLMGMSGNDYAYMEYVKNRYKYVADLGSFLVYIKNDKATFAKDLISELDNVNSFGKGFADPTTDVPKVFEFLQQIFLTHFDEFAHNRDFGSGNTFPTFQLHTLITNRFAENLSVSVAKQDFSDSTKELIINLANQILNVIRGRIIEISNTYDIEAYDRFGNKLNYMEALNELNRLSQVLKEMKESVPLPSNTPDIESYKKTYDNLLSVLTEFQKNIPLAGGISPVRPGMGAPDLVYRPMLSKGEMEKLVVNSYNQSLGKNLIYRLDLQEYDEKKELLNKFLFTLAISR